MVLTLEDALTYDKETGRLVWRYRGVPKFDTRFAEKIAGTKTATGYIHIRFGGKFYLAHRVAWKLVHGSWPNLEIDHINGDKSDNRLHNLRVCTTGENRKNMPKRKNKTSQYVGVRRSRNRWAVVVDSKYRGVFKDESEAAAFARSIYAELGFHPNHGRDDRSAA